MFPAVMVHVGHTRGRTPPAKEARTTTTDFNDLPRKDLTDAAAEAHNALGLKHCPVVVRDEGAAHRIAARTKAGAVILGDGAFWVVCLADAERLVAAGYEYAPQN